MSAVLRLARIILSTRAPRALTRFYVHALGFTHCVTLRDGEPAWSHLLGLPGARVQLSRLRLGAQQLDLLRIDPLGRRYPDGVTGPNGLFQHFAMTVTDMDAALARLRAVPGWEPISVGGPQTLPPASGAVTAFKFRDPEGHPLEFIKGLAAVPGQINHSAISVQSVGPSCAFYESLGLRPTGGSLNIGREQDRLDAVPEARLEVRSLALPDGSAPHVELLCYGDGFRRPAVPSAPNDVAATCLVFTVRDAASLHELLLRHAPGTAPTGFADGSLRALLRDPDGHWLCLEVPPTDGPSAPQPPVANPG